MRRPASLAGMLLAIVVSVSVARAQDLPASSSSTGMDAMACMEHGAMQDMEMPAHVHATAPFTPAHHAMPVPRTYRYDPATPRAHAGAMPSHAMGPMQGGDPPTDARDPDYSDGIPPVPMHGIGVGMDDDPKQASLRVDQLEVFHGTDSAGQQWEIGAGYGTSRDGLWLRTEGERTRGRLDTADVEALWQHAVAAFWDTQWGVRTDTGEGPSRQWIAFGIQGLAPYWFELEATGYVGPAGRTAARLRASYELLFTQRLVLQPELELDAYGKADPARHLGGGVSAATLGLRLRYELSREVAPYLGWEWTRRFGSTADDGRAGSEGPHERRWVAGLHIRF